MAFGSAAAAGVSGSGSRAAVSPAATRDSLAAPLRVARSVRPVDRGARGAGRVAQRYGSLHDAGREGDPPGERKLGVAPSGYDARRIAEALVWQSERLCFRVWAQIPGAMSKKQLAEVCLEAYMRMIFLAVDPDPEGPRRGRRSPRR